MTIVYLQPDNFYVNPYNEMCNNINGFSFVLFTSKHCAFCKDIIPSFRSLANHIDGCTFVEMDVDQQQQKIRSIAANSNTPINFVPYLLFYINGRPTARYIPEEQTPHINYDKMKQFLIMQSQQHHAPKDNKAAAHKSLIPEYSIGKPICSGKNVCYLGYDSAYKKAK